MTKTKRIHISLPADLVKKLDKICKESYLTRSEALKRCIMAIINSEIGFDMCIGSEDLPKNQCTKCGGWFSDEAMKEHICKK